MFEQWIESLEADNEGTYQHLGTIVCAASTRRSSFDMLVSDIFWSSNRLSLEEWITFVQEHLRHQISVFFWGGNACILRCQRKSIRNIICLSFWNRA